MGFNCAEASNFGSPEWPTIARKYEDCNCALGKEQRVNSERTKLDVATLLRMKGAYKKDEKPEKVCIFYVHSLIIYITYNIFLYEITNLFLYYFSISVNIVTLAARKNALSKHI